MPGADPSVSLQTQFPDVAPGRAGDGPGTRALAAHVGDPDGMFRPGPAKAVVLIWLVDRHMEPIPLYSLQVSLCLLDK